MQRTEFEQIVRKAGTPVMIVDHATIRYNYESFRALLPGVHPFYAIKANPEFDIVSSLLHLGAGFDVASWEEFNIVRKVAAGIVPDFHEFVKERVILANTIKPISTLKKLKHFTIRMTVDNVEELHKIATHCPEQPLVMRIEVPNDGALVELSSKFGTPLHQCKEVLETASALGLNVIGVSFHVGSQCTNLDNFPRAFDAARRVFDEAACIGYKFTLLDIGGGYPAPYTTDVAPFEELAAIIKEQIDTHFPGTTIIAEPGRFLVATAATSFASVVGKAHRAGKPYYYINDGVYNTFSGFIFDHVQYHFKAFKEGETTPSAVGGPTCDALDTITRDDPLPDLEVGDIIYAENTGAYTSASATHFNGFPPARVLHVNTSMIPAAARAQESARGKRARVIS